MQTLQAKNEVVWAPDPIEGYVKGVIVDIKTDGLVVKGDNRKMIYADFDQIFPVESKEKDVDDNCSLMYLNSANMVNNCKIRYERNCVYTNVANILVAINPYKDIPKLYNQESMKQYKGKSFGTLPPHIFAIADQSYRNMKTEKVSQSIIVSGESGAGKTETTKYILKYLTECYGIHVGNIEQRINESNPLLEAFGNAKTVRNNNSSRSGKFVEIHFNSKTQITGAIVSHYLLEKSRICKQSSNERNYHIFYRMCAGMEQSEREKLALLNPDHYNYLKFGSTRYFGSKSDNGKITKTQQSSEFLKCGFLSDVQMNDVADYKKTMTAMKDMGISDPERWDILSILAGILYLGNIEFIEGSDSQGGCAISKTQASQDALKQASRLLGFDTNMLADLLCNRYTVSAGNKTSLRIALRICDAENARDALSKTIYVRLFEEIVTLVNRALPFTDSANFIGILDIAGFEYFEKNNFEQFCINYCNEKMQQFFNLRVMKEEQILYEKEGLGLEKIHFVDNQDCIDLIELKQIGIIDILDEESKVPKPSSENFTNTIFKSNSNNFRLQLPRKSKLKLHRELRDTEGFIIRHYAGAVCYHTEQFIAKNNDALHDSLRTLLDTSKIKLMENMFVKNEKEDSKLLITSKKTQTAGKLAFVSVASKFRASLDQLMKKLHNSGSNFIRCIKPNLSMVPNKWEGGVVLSQLECSGMITVLDLMHQGYPTRTKFQDLYDIYSKLLPKELARLDAKLFSKLLFKVVGLNSADYTFGMTKVFFRPGKMAEFDKLIRSDPEHVKTLVAKVKTWLIKYRWRKAQYGVWEVIKLKNKIIWRRERIVKIQASIRMWFAMKKYGPKIKGFVRIKNMESMILQMSQIVGQLKGGKSKGSSIIDSSKKTIIATKQKIKSLSMKDNKNIPSLVDACQKDLEQGLSSLRKEVDKEKKKEEQERLQKIQAEMELERRKNEEEKLKLAEKEEEKKKKIEIEKKRKQEELKQAEQNRRESATAKSKKPRPKSDLTALKETMDNHIDDITKEQERRDRELAIRIGDGDLSTVVADENNVSKAAGRNIGSANLKTSVSNKDVNDMDYEELRHVINSSNDIKRIEACQAEFHRRINAYNQWKLKQAQKKNEQLKISPDTSISSSNASAVLRNSLASKPQIDDNTKNQRICSSRASMQIIPPPVGKFPPQRYFRLPFSGSNENDLSGLWFGHFDGEYIARQIELHDENTKLVLIAGVDDLAMCDLPLTSTGLILKKGAEITENEFERVWIKLSGHVSLMNKAQYVTSHYLRAKFLSKNAMQNKR